MADDPNNPPDDGGGKPAPDLTHPDVLALIEAEKQKAVEAEVAGLKKKNGEVIGDNKKLKEQIEEYTSKFGDADPEMLAGLAKQLAENQDAKDIAEGRIDDVIARRVEQQRVAHEKQVEELTKQLTEANKNGETLQGKMNDLVVAGAVRDAATDAGIIATAVPDVIGRAKSVFKLGEDDTLTATGPDGAPLFGKDAKSPMTPKEWLDTMKETAPHWFPGSAGAGAGGGGGSDASDHTITREEARNPRLYQERKEAAKKAGVQLTITQ